MTLALLNRMLASRFEGFHYSPIFRPDPSHASQIDGFSGARSQVLGARHVLSSESLDSERNHRRTRQTITGGNLESRSPCLLSARSRKRPECIWSRCRQELRYAFLFSPSFLEFRFVRRPFPRSTLADPSERPSIGSLIQETRFTISVLRSIYWKRAIECGKMFRTMTKVNRSDQQ